MGRVVTNLESVSSSSSSRKGLRRIPNFIPKRMTRTYYNAESDVWKDCTGERYSGFTLTQAQLDAANKAAENLNNQTENKSGKGWDFANNAVDLFGKITDKILDIRGGKGNEVPGTTVVVAEDKPGIGAFGVIAIVAGVALAGFLVYKAVKK